MVFPGFHRTSGIRAAVTFLILFSFWIILSGYFDTFHLGAGIICCAIVTFISADLLFQSTRTIASSAGTFIRFLLFIPRLMVSILVANIDVAYRILHPKMPVDPGIITVETPFQDDVLRTAFATAMTLTPGTITVDVSGSTFIVHALMKEQSEKDLVVDQEMERRLAGIFRVDP
ncbi:na(+)/h(+) antiporter subunit e [hydrocarbon metagenome]|uniref:Na(+)/h(+) antiporter subunit e n=1 Tax=hydrocarbon metagenome TaxID=938273 RepID=A0A0W8F1W9_9ZZZZ